MEQRDGLEQKSVKQKYGLQTCVRIHCTIKTIAPTNFLLKKEGSGSKNEENKENIHVHALADKHGT